MNEDNSYAVERQEEERSKMYLSLASLMRRTKK
jgi:hypothetical protein